MLLWDIIRDFFVQNVFGGYDSLGEYYYITTGFFVDSDFNYIELGAPNSFFVPISGFSDAGDNSFIGLTLSDWLSTTATIITLVLLVIFLALFVRWMFRLFAGLLSR